MQQGVLVTLSLFFRTAAITFCIIVNVVVWVVEFFLLFFDAKSSMNNMVESCLVVLSSPRVGRMACFCLSSTVDEVGRNLEKSFSSNFAALVYCTRTFHRTIVPTRHKLLECTCVVIFNGKKLVL